MKIRSKLGFFVTYFLIIVLFCFVLYRVFDIQIARSNEYIYNAKQAYIYSYVLYPLRGKIYDRYGKVLADNQLKYRIFVYSKDVDKINDEIAKLANIFGNYVFEKYRDSIDYLNRNPYIDKIYILDDLEYDERLHRFEIEFSNNPVINYEEYYKRVYLYPNISHVLGYIGYADDNQIKTGKYQHGDYVGKTGIEYQFEDILSGQKGKASRFYSYVEREYFDTIISQPKNGSDVYLTIDVDLQNYIYQVIEQVLKTKYYTNAISISVVVKDLKTGDLLAIVSVPTFDSNLFVDGISLEKYDEYLQNPGKPLINKPFQYAQNPGSTFKIFIDYLLLANKIVDPNEFIETGGVFRYKDIEFVDYNRINWGRINMSRAICVSSNIYHMRGVLQWQENSDQDIATTIAHLADKSEITQIDEGLFGTINGYFPYPEGEKQMNRTWLPGELLNAVIGQGKNQITPLGAVNLVSLIANNGVYVKSRLIIDKNSNTNVNQYQIIGPIDTDPIYEGMKCTTESSARTVGGYPKDYPLYYSKTGTAETGRLSDGKEIIHGWEVSFGPIDDPKYAISVFVENGRLGNYASLISREIYKYLRDK